MPGEPPVVGLLADLIRIESINPSHDAAGSGEGPIGRFVADWARRRKLDVEVQPVLPGGRDNVLVRVDSGRPGPHLMLEAHMDTVTVTGMTIPPFEPTVREGRLYGRGACDVKGGLAAMLTAVAEAAGRRTWRGRLTMAAAVDEEYGFQGALQLGKTIKADGGVVAEPTDLQVVTAHRGVVRWRITAEGRAAHSSKPQLGRNAITAMARVITHLDAAFARELSSKVHPLVGPCTAAITLITGGVQVNWIPPDCTITCEVRLIPGQKVEDVMALTRRELAQVPGLDPDIKLVNHDPYLDSLSLDISPATPIAQAALAAVGQAAPAGAPYGTDASKLTACGIPSVVLGPGSIDQAHGAVEWIDVGQLVKSVELYGRIVDRFCA
jgi:acetylornithine deacetylase